jgi:hypothetical protein
LIEADPTLRGLRDDLRRIEAETGKPVAYDEGRDPNTLAEAVRALAVCQKGEL